MSSDLDSVDTSQHIKLGDVEGAVAIEFVRELDHIEIEPAAFSHAAGGSARFVTHGLNFIANLARQVGWEGTRTDSSGVCFDDANGSLDSLRR